MCEIITGADFIVLKGLPTPAAVDSFVFKIIFTYIPIAIGMAIEPVLIIIATCQCMMAPYTALDLGPAVSSRSLALDYDQYPPHFQLYRSLRTGNLALAGLTTTILLSNVLSVALAGLFSSTTRPIYSTTMVHTYPPPQFQSSFTSPAMEMYFTLFGTLSSGPAARTAPSWTTDNYYVLPIELTNPAGVEQYQVSTLGIGVDIKCAVVPATAFCVRFGSEGEPPLPSCRSELALSQYLTINDPCWLSPNGEPNMERIQWFELSDDYMTKGPKCSDTFFVMWVEYPAKPQFVPTNFTTRQDHYSDYPEGLALKCEIVDKVAELTGQVTAKGQVLSMTVVRQLDNQEILALYPPNKNSSLASSFIDAIILGIDSQLTESDHQLAWANYFAAIIDPRAIRKRINVTHIPDAAYIGKAIEEVIQRLFPINLQLFENTIIAPREQLQNMVPVEAVVVMERVTMDPSMFTISVSILVLMIIVLVVVYWGQRQPIGHLPESLVGMYALLYASNAMEECAELMGRNPKERAQSLKELGFEYAYGEFQDGKRYGVYREEDDIKKGR